MNESRFLPIIINGMRLFSNCHWNWKIWNMRDGDDRLQRHNNTIYSHYFYFVVSWNRFNIAAYLHQTHFICWMEPLSNKQISFYILFRREMCSMNLTGSSSVRSFISLKTYTYRNLHIYIAFSVSKNFLYCQTIQND